jgi:hypothetical protein
MARGGKVRITETEGDGKKYFALFPMMPGLFENIFADGIDTEPEFGHHE